MTPTTGKGKNIALWILQIALAGMFLMAGGSKLAGAAAMVKVFEEVGIGQWFRYLTGSLEVIAAILLLIPGRAALGAALIVPIMIGAILTHVAVLHNNPAMPAVLLVLAAVVLWGRWNQIAALLGR